MKKIIPLVIIVSLVFSGCGHVEKRGYTLETVNQGKQTVEYKNITFNFYTQQWCAEHIRK